jgi:hypothetical protein
MKTFLKLAIWVFIALCVGVAAEHFNEGDWLVGGVAATFAFALLAREAGHFWLRKEAARWQRS